MRLAHIRKKLAEDPTVTRKVYYRRPYTVVVIESPLGTGVGIAKVSWPDKWSDRMGKTIAMSKAEHDLAQQIDAQQEYPQVMAYYVTVR